MLRLFVMRHAKSSWAIPGARDFDRELNERGRADLKKISQALKERKYFPQTVLCSTALRTRQTLDGIIGSIEPAPEIEITEQLYSGGMDAYLKLISSQKKTGSIMTIGHNPMSASLASVLCGSGDDALRETIGYKYPTCATAVIDFDCSQWQDLAIGTGQLIDFLSPSQL